MKIIRYLVLNLVMGKNSGGSNISMVLLGITQIFLYYCINFGLLIDKKSNKQRMRGEHCIIISWIITLQ